MNVSCDKNTLGQKFEVLDVSKCRMKSLRASIVPIEKDLKKTILSCIWSDKA